MTRPTNYGRPYAILQHGALGYDPAVETEPTPAIDRAVDIPPETSTTTGVTLTSSPNGGWPGSLIPVARQYNGVVYVGWVDSAGNVEIAAYTDETGVIIGSIFTLHATLEVDWHDAPAVAILANGKIITAYSKHAALGGAMHVRVSTNAEDISAFGAEANIDAQLGGDRYTYPSLFVEPSGKVWLFYRDTTLVGGETSRWAYSTSTDNGVTWAAQTIFYSDSLLLPYMAIEYDGATRFDIAMTSTTGAGSDMLHFYLTTTGGKFQTDGTTIAGAFPLDAADVTLVHDGSAGGARYAASVAYNSGNPVITWPEGIGTAAWYYARWDGSAWVNTSVASDGASGEPWGEGGFVVDPANPSAAFLSRSVSGSYQVFRYVTTDDGATWTGTQLTASVTDDFYVFHVRDAVHLRGVWLRGTAASFTSYTLQVLGILLDSTGLPAATDADDATYETVTGGTDVLRIDLGDAYRIVRGRLRIASELAGSRTYSIYGAETADYSDEVLLDSVTFTAVGTYTAQDVAFSWADDGTARQYYRLEGTAETRRIHSFELYTASSDLSDYATLDDLDAHLDDTLDAHDASAVSIVDAGAYFTGTDVEAALQELGAAPPSSDIWAPLMVEDGATGLWYVVVTGDGDAVLVEVS